MIAARFRAVPRRLLSLLLALIVPALAAAAETARVTRVVDGDTIQVQLAGVKEVVRLIGVDCPELHHPQRPVEAFAREAASFTRDAALGHKVKLEGGQGTRDRDRYGRLLRYVFLEDGTLLNEHIVSSGFGHVLTRYPFDRMEAFRKAERTAREKERGLWAPNDQPFTDAVPGN